ncbi:hypothetical protein RJ640_024607 [Escallonia rubra]|uniref:Uncharacterized protein n=1 Tax=Escallonia rubra TaxID=112253 RepID=A0AA88RI34_9ASTE|nr:hypothetical protein RJ640_024607 [Escallonia rubra]
MPVDQAELDTEQVLKRDIPCETYMTMELISGTGLQMLKRYAKKSKSYREQFLDDEAHIGHFEWSPMHKDPTVWRESITNFEDMNFESQHHWNTCYIAYPLILRQKIVTGSLRALHVGTYKRDAPELNSLKYHIPAGRTIVTDLKPKGRVMKLMNHEECRGHKKCLAAIQRLILGAKREVEDDECLRFTNEKALKSRRLSINGIRVGRSYRATRTFPNAIVCPLIFDRTVPGTRRYIQRIGGPLDHANGLSSTLAIRISGMVAWAKLGI